MLHIEYLKSVQFEACGCALAWCWEWELYSAKYRELIKKEVSLNSIWIGPYCCCISRAQRQQRKSAARPQFSFRASPGFISAAIIENCESRGQPSLATVPTSALHNLTTQNSPKILTHLVVDGTQKVYDKYINKGRKNWRMSFSHSFLRPPVQCDVESNCIDTGRCDPLSNVCGGVMAVMWERAAY